MPGYHGIFDSRHIGKKPDILKCPGNPVFKNFVGPGAQDGFPVEQHIAAGSLVDTGEDIKNGGLAGPVGTDEPQYFPRVDRKTDFRQGQQPPEPHTDVFKF